MRLIDADTLKAEFTGNFNELWHYTGVRAIIDNAPTIEAVHVKHGKWSINDDMWGEPYSIRCSECGEEFVAYEQTLEELANDYKYCPQCGTRNVLSLETETSDNEEDDEND